MKGAAELLIFPIIAVGFVLSIWVAYRIPGRIKRRHVAQSNDLMERCRAEYLLAVTELERGDRAAAEIRLGVIRELERQWQRRNAFANRCALALAAMVLSATAYLFIRQVTMILPLWFEGGSWSVLVDRSLAATLTPSVAALGILGAVWGMHSWHESWIDPAIVDDCGDRLYRDLFSLREVRAPKGRARRPVNHVANLTDREIFGLGDDFSLKELDRARRSLAARFHPDVVVAHREAAEETMKHINAAYDRLKSACPP